MHLMLHTQLVLLVLILSVLHLYRRSASLSRCISVEGSVLSGAASLQKVQHLYLAAFLQKALCSASDAASLHLMLYVSR